MYYCSISKCTKDFKTGLTNQIFSLITGIFVAIAYKHKVIVVDSFLNDFEKGGYTILSEIINLDKLRDFLKKHYDILIIEKHNATFQLVCIHYGTEENFVDITSDMRKLCIHNNFLYINKNINFNSIKGDPCPGVEKRVTITYIVNNYPISESYSEKFEGMPEEYISIDFINTIYTHLFHWGELLETQLFVDILLSIDYSEEFVKKSQIIYKNIDMYKKINIIHLRIEEDAIHYWAIQNNNMNKDTFRIILTYRYIQLIKKYINKDDETIILSSSLSNGVIDYLTENKYNFRFSEKFYEDREKNAIVDLLISKQCNNIFIGGINLKKNNGSTFSYYIVKLLKENVKKVCIDLHEIYNEENVVY